MTMGLYFVIGADGTGIITPEYEQKLQAILSKRWENFTLTKHRGCYKGKMEDAISVTIFAPNLILADLDDCIRELKLELDQKEIGVDINPNSKFELK